MNKRTIRTIAVGAGASALVLGMAAPAMAADIDKLPAKTSIAAPGGTQGVVIPVANQPAGFTCGTADVTWMARVPGKQDAILLNGVKTPITLDCAGGTLSFTVSSNNDSAKKNAVVKVIGVNSVTQEKAVMTLVVKVTGKTGNPGKGKKPSS